MIALEAQEFPPRDGDHGVLDGLGLMLRVANGRGSWVFRYTVMGKRREMGLGRQPFTTPQSLAEAREALTERAVELRRVIDAGRDPLAERDAARGTDNLARIRAKGLTIRRALRMWADYEEPRRKWAKKTIQCVMRTIDKETPDWLAETPVVDMTCDMMIEAISQISAPGRKDLFRQRFSWCFEWLMDSGQVDANAAGILRIVRGRFDPIWPANEKGQHD